MRTSPKRSNQSSPSTQDEFRLDALKAVERAASTHRLFIVDDVWEYMPAKAYGKDRRAMGPIITEASKRGICSSTGGAQRSSQPQCHGNKRTVWRSRILAGK